MLDEDAEDVAVTPYDRAAIATGDSERITPEKRQATATQLVDDMFCDLGLEPEEYQATTLRNTDAALQNAPLGI